MAVRPMACLRMPYLVACTQACCALAGGTAPVAACDPGQEQSAWPVYFGGSGLWLPEAGPAAAPYCTGRGGPLVHDQERTQLVTWSCWLAFGHSYRQLMPASTSPTCCSVLRQRKVFQQLVQLVWDAQRGASNETIWFSLLLVLLCK